VFVFTGSAGFGSVVNIMIHAIKFAKDNGREFYLKDVDWRGGPMNRWHDGFKTLTTYNPEKHGHEHTEAGHPQFAELKANKFSDLSEVVKEIFVLKDDLAQKAKDFTESIGGPYTSIYVRRGDKVEGCDVAGAEMAAMSAQELLKESGITDDVSRLFIMTDDYSVVEELKAALPSCKIFTLTPEKNRGLAQNSISKFTPEEKKEQGDELITSMQVFLNGEKGCADNRSNLGRLLKLAKPDTVQLYPVSEHSKALTPDTLIGPAWKQLGEKAD